MSQLVMWLNSIDLHALVLFMVVLAFLIGVFCFVSIVSLDRDNEEIRKVIGEILENLEEKKACQK